jgi:hypothetical protein
MKETTKMRVEIEDTFLTSKPINAPHPRNKPWNYYLFATHITKDKRGRERRKRDVITLTGKRKKDCDAQLVALCEKRGVRVVGN